MFNFKKKGRAVVLEEGPEQNIKLENEKINLKKQYLSDVLKDKKLPIVLLDPLWHVMRENIQSEIIKNKEKKLQELLKEQGKLNNDYREYGVVKQNFLKDILNLSGKVGTSVDEAVAEELSKLHQSTLGVNQKLEDIEVRLEQVEREIQDINRSIIEEMSAISYEYIDECKNRVIKLDKEIVELREEMLIKTNEKKSCDKVIKDVYNYLHSIIGREHIELIDKTLGEQK